MGCEIYDSVHEGLKGTNDELLSNSNTVHQIQKQYHPQCYHLPKLVKFRRKKKVENLVTCYLEADILSVYIPSFHFQLD